MRVIVVGAGIMGLAAAWGLHRRGHQVTVLERSATVPNPRGSSVDDHRVIRHAYGSLHGYAALMLDAFTAWDTLWADLGTRYFVKSGVLYVARGGAAELDASVASLGRLEVPIEEHAVRDAAARWPHLRFEAEDRVVLLPESGVLLAGAIVGAIADHLRDAGVEIRTGTDVTAVEPEVNAVRIGTERMQADAVVVAAGPWIGRLLPQIGARAVPSRQALLYFDPSPDWRAAWADSPVLGDISADIGLYIVPPVAGRGLKLGDHRFTMTGDPEESRIGTAEDIARLSALARTRVADFDRCATVRCHICFYDVAPETRFILERLDGNSWVMSGFSGHGFKFGALMGLGMAEAVEGARSPAAMTAWAAGLERESERVR